MPGKQKPPTGPQHDAAYKNFFTHARTVEDTLHAAATDLAGHLDFSTLERMPDSFVTERLGQRHADMLWRIGTSTGGWVYILILLEFQSTVDPRMALRMMDYVSTIWMRLRREDLGPGGEYPFVLPIVIYNGEPRWTAATDIADLLPPGIERLLGRVPRLWYLLIKIREQDPDSLPLDNVLATMARFEQAPTAEALEELAGSLDERLEAIGEPGLDAPFRTWIELVLTLRHGSKGEQLRRTLRKAREEKGTMTLIERARKWGEERDQLWLQRGRQEGMEKQRELVHRLTSLKFGATTAEKLLPRLGRLTDQEDIVAVADAVIECATAEEFLKRVAAPRERAAAG